jgi:hypothetical protein
MIDGMRLNARVYIYRRHDGSTFESDQRIAEDSLVSCPTTGRQGEVGLRQAGVARASPARACVAARPSSCNSASISAGS